MKGRVCMNLLDLIELLDTNYSGSDGEYDFFMRLIDNCISENDHNPFSGLESDTVEHGVRGQHGLSKSKFKKVLKAKSPSRLVKFIKDSYSDEKQYCMECEIRKSIPDFNSEGADFAYPCSDLLFQLINEYSKTQKKQREEPAPTENVEIVDAITPTSQPEVQQIIQNQFNITQNGNGINIGHANTIEIRDGKVVTLK